MKKQAVLIVAALATFLLIAGASGCWQDAYERAVVMLARAEVALGEALVIAQDLERKRDAHCAIPDPEPKVCAEAERFLSEALGWVLRLQKARDLAAQIVEMFKPGAPPTLAQKDAATIDADEVARELREFRRWAKKQGGSP